jgi:hypothetical protein
VYRDVLLLRWRNARGRTMWDFPGGRTGGNRYLVLGFGTGRAADLAVSPDGDMPIAYGPPLSDEGATWVGTAASVAGPFVSPRRSPIRRGCGRAGQTTTAIASTSIR